MDYASRKSELRQEIQRALADAFDDCPDDEVTRVGRYVGLGGGHRWRALVAIAAGEIFEKRAVQIVMPGAIAVELAHCASLVLDDLPSMDDAQVRRGQPCPHLVFPNWAVDMAPVFLLTLAYDVALSNRLATEQRRVAAAIVLSRAGRAMIAGQSLDVDLPRESVGEEQLLERYRLKSAELYAASAEGGGLLCNADDNDCRRLRDIGLNLGLAYQVLDDIADVTATVATVGKDTSRDERKITSVNLFGLAGARRQGQEFQSAAMDLASGFGAKAGFLHHLVSTASWASS